MGMGKGRNCAVVKPCDRERELGETSGVGGQLTLGLHRTCSTVMPVRVGFQWQGGNEQYCRELLAVLSHGQSTRVWD